MERVYEFLNKSKPYYLATVDGDQPHVRPFGTVDLFEGKLYFQTGKEKNVAKQLKKNAKIEISSAADGAWIRITAQAVLDERLEPQQHMLDTHPNLKDRYKAGDGNNEVYYLENATAQIFEAGKEPQIIVF